MRLIPLLLSTLFLLAACGTRGALVMPPSQAPEDHSSKPVEPAR